MIKKKKDYIGHKWLILFIRSQLSWCIKSSLLYLLDMEQKQIQALVQTLGSLIWFQDFRIS